MVVTPDPRAPYHEDPRDAYVPPHRSVLDIASGFWTVVVVVSWSWSGRGRGRGRGRARRRRIHLSRLHQIDWATCGFRGHERAAV